MDVTQYYLDRKAENEEKKAMKQMEEAEDNANQKSRSEEQKEKIVSVAKQIPHFFSSDIGKILGGGTLLSAAVGAVKEAINGKTK